MEPPLACRRQRCLRAPRSSRSTRSVRARHHPPSATRVSFWPRVKPLGIWEDGSPLRGASAPRRGFQTTYRPLLSFPRHRVVSHATTCGVLTSTRGVAVPRSADSGVDVDAWALRIFARLDFKLPHTLPPTDHIPEVSLGSTPFRFPSQTNVRRKRSASARSTLSGSRYVPPQIQTARGSHKNETRCTRVPFCRSLFAQLEILPRLTSPSP